MRLAALVTVATLLSVTPALAQPGLTPAGPPRSGPVAPVSFEKPPTRVKTYGSQIALLDLASFGVMLGGSYLALDEALSDGVNDGNAPLAAALMLTGMVGYGIGGAIIHGVNGNGQAAWKSIGLRLGLPLVGGLIGASMTRRHCDYGSCYEEEGPWAPLALLGAATAMAIDWFALARVEVPANPTVTPYVSRTNGGMTFGIAAGF